MLLIMAQQLQVIDKCHNLVRFYAKKARHLWILIVDKVIIQP